MSQGLFGPSPLLQCKRSKGVELETQVPRRSGVKDPASHSVIPVSRLQLIGMLCTSAGKIILGTDPDP